MGLIVHVYRWNLGDCTNRGISSRAHELCLVNVEGPFNPRQDCPAAMLVHGNGRNIAKIVPAARREDGTWIAALGWWMMGGNYAATSDSRFTEAVERITGARFYGAIPVHDRTE